MYLSIDRIRNVTEDSTGTRKKIFRNSLFTNKKPQANFSLYAEAHNLPYLTHTNMRLRQTDFLAVLIQMQELQEHSE